MPSLGTGSITPARIIGADGRLLPSLIPTAVNARAPTPADDNTVGYSATDLWVAPGNALYQALSTNTGAAVWQPLTPPLPGDLTPLPTSGFGTRLLNVAYTTNSCLDVLRASDSTTKTIGFTPDGLIDWRTLRSFIASTTGRVTKLYDQFGSNNLTVPTGCVGPCINITLTTNGAPNLVFDNGTGFQAGVATPTPNKAAALSNTTAPVINMTNTGGSMMCLGRMLDSNSTTLSTVMGQAQAATFPIRVYQGSGASDMTADDTVFFYGATTVSMGGSSPLTPSVFGYSIPAGGATALCLVKGAYKTVSQVVPLSGAFTGIELGFSAAQANGAPWALDAYLVYSAPLTQTQMQTIHGGLAALYGALPQLRDVLVIDGDSIGAGTGSTQGQVPARIFEQYLPKMRIHGVAVAGSTTVQRTAILAATLAQFNPLARNNVLYYEGGTNSVNSYLVAGQSAAQAQVSAYADLVVYVNAVRAFNPAIKIVVATLYQFGTYSAAGYNNLVRANAAGADGIADRALSPIMNALTYATNPNIYTTDASGHPTDLGVAQLVPYEVRAISSVLH